MTSGELMLLAIAVPMLGSIGIAGCSNQANLRETVTLLTGGALFACVAALLPEVMSGARPQLQLLELLPGLPLVFQLEPLGMLFALIASSLWIVNSVYSIGYMRGNNETHQTRFYVCFALAISAAIGIAFAGNLLTLFLFYEILTLITYPLVTHQGTDQARQGGRTYLGLLVGTSVMFLLPAIIFTWHIADTTDFRPGGILAGLLAPASLAMLLALYIFGIGKAALMPFHRWLPAAMVAPTPVSALLHAVAVVKAGVFTVLKVIVYIFGTETLKEAAGTNWLLGIACFTIIAASIVALYADNLKRRLAYSTVSQLAYVVLAAAMLLPWSITGAALHLATHAVAKITLFFAAGSIYTAAHKTEVSQLDGIGWRMPWTMAAFSVAALSLIGVPPTAGFVSKWFILTSAAEGRHYLVLVTLILSTLLNAAYFLPVIYAAFFKPLSANDAARPHGEAPLPILIALLITAGSTIALFFLSAPLLQLAQQLAATAL